MRSATPMTSEQDRGRTAPGRSRYSFVKAAWTGFLVAATWFFVLNLLAQVPWSAALR